MAKELLRAENLEKHFPVTKGLILMMTVGHGRAVDGVNFSINEGETLGPSPVPFAFLFTAIARTAFIRNSMFQSPWPLLADL